jgi:hypothetical protein
MNLSTHIDFSHSKHRTGMFLSINYLIMTLQHQRQMFIFMNGMFYWLKEQLHTVIL